jgi:hypothetical protein
MLKILSLVVSVKSVDLEPEYMGQKVNECLSKHAKSFEMLWTIVLVPTMTVLFSTVPFRYISQYQYGSCCAHDEQGGKRPINAGIERCLTAEIVAVVRLF